MASQTIPRLTEEEYLALDPANPSRSEYIDGEMLYGRWLYPSFCPCGSL